MKARTVMGSAAVAAALLLSGGVSRADAAIVSLYPEIRYGGIASYADAAVPKRYYIQRNTTSSWSNPTRRQWCAYNDLIGRPDTLLWVMRPGRSDDWV